MFTQEELFREVTYNLLWVITLKQLNLFDVAAVEFHAQHTDRLFDNCKLTRQLRQGALSAIDGGLLVKEFLHSSSSCSTTVVLRVFTLFGLDGATILHVTG